MKQDIRKTGGTSLDPVFLCAFLIMIAGLFCSEFFTLSQNRIVSGSLVSIRDIAGPYSFLAPCILFLSVWKFSRTFLKNMAFGAVFLVFYGLLYQTGTFADSVLQSNSIARFSPSWGFWIFFLGVCFFYTASIAAEKNSFQRFFFTSFFILPFCILFSLGVFTNFALGREFAVQEARFSSEVIHHILLSYGSVAAACLAGIPIGYYAFLHPQKGERFFYFLNIIQTIPGIALFTMIMTPVALLVSCLPFLKTWGISGTGTTPAVIALFLYALLPVVKNTLEGLKVIDPAVLESGKGMGMDEIDLLVKIELPLSLPVILNGVRTALVHCVGSTAVAALIGAGGLGMFIFQGIGQGSSDLILLGSLPLVLLAVLTDRIMAFLTKMSFPKGLTHD